MNDKKGLGALKGAMTKLNNNNLAGKRVVIIDINDIEVDPDNPRKFYDEEGIVELALSIDDAGQLEPISARDNSEVKGKYFSNFGSRRILAVKWLKENKPDSPHANTIEALIDNDFQSLGKLIENIQREELTAFDIGSYLKKEVQDKGFSPKELGEKLGKNKSWVSRHLNVTEISDYVKKLVDDQLALNVEVILNIEKLYKSNEEDLIERVETFKADNENGGAITLALSRKWLKSAVGEQESITETTSTDSVDREVQTVSIESDSSNDNEDAEKAFKLNETLKDENLTVQELKELQQNAENLIDAAPKKTVSSEQKTKSPISEELRSEYANGALTGYKNLFDFAVENEDEAEAQLSKQVLKSFAGQDVLINWKSVGEYPNLLEEISQILSCFQSIGYVSPKDLKDKDVELLINQQDLL